MAVHSCSFLLIVKFSWTRLHLHNSSFTAQAWNSVFVPVLSSQNCNMWSDTSLENRKLGLHTAQSDLLLSSPISAWATTPLSCRLNAAIMQMLLRGNWPKLTYASHTTSSPQTLSFLLPWQGCVLFQYKQSIRITTLTWRCVAETKSGELCLELLLWAKDRAGRRGDYWKSIHQWCRFTQLIDGCHAHKHTHTVVTVIKL